MNTKMPKKTSKLNCYPLGKEQQAADTE